MTQSVRVWHHWFSLGGITAAAAAAGVQWAGIQGPWSLVVLISAALALFGALLARRAVPAVKEQVAQRENLVRMSAELEDHKRLESELMVAKQAAEAAMMAKGEFLATMSHEIRTPLNGVVPLLDLLLSSPMPPDQRDHVQTAFSSAKQLLRIVDDILDYSKLEANKLDLESVGLNLREVLDGVLRLMQKAADAKGLKLMLSIEPQVRLAARGDPVRLRQVMTNLVSNAIKFTERGSVSVSVSRKSETRTQHELRFEVRDTGVGITAISAARLFRPFSQADASTTRTYGGTGLGLVICKRIVDLMGGQIGVDSEVGQGSVFWFQIPLLKAMGDIGTRKRDLNGARVLLVTGNAAQQRRFAMALPSWGAMMVHAGNTQDAFAKLRAAAGRSSSWSFDLMMVDAGAIPSTLLALHRGVMRETSLEDLRVIYLRAEDDVPGEIVDNERVRILRRDSADGELRQQIQRVLDEEPGRAPAAPAEPPKPVRPHGLPPDAPIRGHVLLVEDNPVNRQVAQRLLQLAGVTVEWAENGKEAVDKINAAAYDAVLMDCQMPVMDGYAATRQIRADEDAGGRPRIAIIAMTANAMAGDREKCLNAGMDDYLTKPLNRALMEETLRRWLPAISVVPQTDAVARAVAPTRSPPPPVEMPATASELIAAIPIAASRHSVPVVIRHAPLPDEELPVVVPPVLVQRNLVPGTEADDVDTVIAPVMAKRAGVPVSPPRPAASPAPAAVARPAAPAAGRGNGAAPAPVADKPVLNTEIVDDLREIMGEEFLGLVRVFLEDAPQALVRLELAAAHGDADALVGPAHSLKSTSANLGALALSEIARTIEHGARQKNLANPASQVEALGHELRRVEQALRGFLG